MPPRRRNTLKREAVYHSEESPLSNSCPSTYGELGLLDIGKAYSYSSNLKTYNLVARSMTEFGFSKNIVSVNLESDDVQVFCFAVDREISFLKLEKRPGKSEMWWRRRYVDAGHEIMTRHNKDSFASLIQNLIEDVVSLLKQKKYLYKD